ncbi:MAG: helix-turn-helix transcriptional regulator [Gammaproteobacteria bacterium]|nr:AraC family transcriptional regulator [Gammaproteobacteria bacterium]NNJ97535.1 helix-turn-helix transcriptional regulator [Gammaproteobacteria bacterium]
MQVAARQLLDSSAKLLTIANEVGYESEAAFSRAFKRVVCMSPRDWRRRR